MAHGKGEHHVMLSSWSSGARAVSKSSLSRFVVGGDLGILLVLSLSEVLNILIPIRR